MTQLHRFLQTLNRSVCLHCIHAVLRNNSINCTTTSPPSHSRLLILRCKIVCHECPHSTFLHSWSYISYWSSPFYFLLYGGYRQRPELWGYRLLVIGYSFRKSQPLDLVSNNDAFRGSYVVAHPYQNPNIS